MRTSSTSSISSRSRRWHFLILGWDRTDAVAAVRCGHLPGSGRARQAGRDPSRLCSSCPGNHCSEPGRRRRLRSRGLGRAVLDVIAFVLGSSSIVAAGGRDPGRSGRGPDRLRRHLPLRPGPGDRHLARSERPPALDSLDHRQCRSRRAGSPGRSEPPTTWSGGERKLAALAGFDSGAGLLAARPGDDGPAAPGGGLDDRGLGPGDAAGPLLAALLSPADRRRGHRRGRLLGRRDSVWVARCGRSNDRRPTAKSPARRRSQHRLAAGRALSLASRSARRCSFRSATTCWCPRGADDSIQGRAAVGRAATNGARARPPRTDLEPSSPVHLGLAKPAAFLRDDWTARRAISSSTICCATRPIAIIRLIRPRTEEIMAALRAPAARADLHGISAVSRAAGILERSLSAVAAGAGAVGRAGRIRAIQIGGAKKTP